MDPDSAWRHVCVSQDTLGCCEPRPSAHNTVGQEGVQVATPPPHRHHFTMTLCPPPPLPPKPPPHTYDTQGTAMPGRPAASALPPTSKSNKLPSSSSNATQRNTATTTGSSLLAAKMADMAAAKAAQQASSSSSGGGGLPGLAERRASWIKTGIIALRDLGLTAIEPSWLQGGSQGCERVCCGQLELLGLGLTCGVLPPTELGI